MRNDSELRYFLWAVEGCSKTGISKLTVLWLSVTHRALLHLQAEAELWPGHQDLSLCLQEDPGVRWGVERLEERGAQHHQLGWLGCEVRTSRARPQHHQPQTWGISGELGVATLFRTEFILEVQWNIWVENLPFRTKISKIGCLGRKYPYLWQNPETGI